MASNVTIVLGVIGADCHAVANKILYHTFTEAGFNVVNLGVMASQSEFIAAAIETDAVAILISSLYGHAEMDCRGLREACVEAGLDDILLYLGGRLVVGKAKFSDVEAKFKEMGFNRIFPPETLPEDGIAQLVADLKERGLPVPGDEK
jgi:methylaspartate mutase sigma subunit